MAVSRLFEILYLLLERGRTTAPALARRFEVSVRTIYRDIDALSAAGVPVYTAPGKGGGISLLEGYVLDRAMFTPEEQRQLLTALRAMPPVAGREAADALSKLSALFHREEPDWLQVDLSGWGGGEEDARFSLLRQAILQKHPVRFSYAGARGGTGQRRVLPARLVFKGRAWYLQGFCLDREDYRTFKVGRMTGLVLEEEVFARRLSPPPVVLAQGTLSFCVPLTLRFAPWMAYRVYDEFDASAVVREEDGALRVQVTFPEDQWLYGYLLSFGAAVEVVEPDTVRHRLGLLAKKIWQGCAYPDTPCQGCRATIERYAAPGMAGTPGTGSPSPPGGGERTARFGVPDGPHEQEVVKMEGKFCQSCGMPLTQELLGTEADGSRSGDYCRYCYQNGGFTGEMTMEEMIDFCVPHMVQSHPELTEQQAREQMRQFFPMLMRWRRD